MSIIKSEDSNKWINALVAIAAVLAGFIVTKFADQLGAWFDLEAKVSSFAVVSQGLGVLAGVLVFVVVLKNSKSSSYLEEVYNELLKVVWPSKDATLKMTIGIAIALVVCSGIFVFVDFVFKKILSFVY
ncbi:MAG: preprotein translocase subunit SecE [Bacteriovorax sp.]|nr:preprotein translocase subunit SecE [Bacteriovorax sp.]